MIHSSLINQSLSVIIPTLNEAEHLPYTLNIVQTATNVETIIVDGGSLDATVKVATGVSRGWGSIIVWGTVDLEQSEQRKKDRR